MNLRDEEATREVIVKTLGDLAHNSAIRPQDPILIYYAGHGSEAPSPDAGNFVNNVRGRMLLPHDFGCHESSPELAQGIDDATLNQLFADIAVRSDNIVSCISAC